MMKNVMSYSERKNTGKRRFEAGGDMGVAIIRML